MVLSKSPFILLRPVLLRFSEMAAKRLALKIIRLGFDHVYFYYFVCIQPRRHVHRMTKQSSCKFFVCGQNLVSPFDVFP